MNRSLPALVLALLLPACNPTPRSERTANFSRATGSLSEWGEGHCECSISFSVMNLSCKSWNSAAIDIDVFELLLPDTVERRQMVSFPWAVRQSLDSSNIVDSKSPAGTAELSVSASDGESFELYLHELQFSESTACDWAGNDCRTKPEGSLINGVVTCQDLR